MSTTKEIRVENQKFIAFQPGERMFMAILGSKRTVLAFVWLEKAEAQQIAEWLMEWVEKP